MGVNPIGEAQDWRDWMDLTTACPQVELERSREELVAGALRYGLRQSDIRAEQICLNQQIADIGGAIFKTGQQKTVNWVSCDEGYVVFEVEIAAKPRYVDEFAEKVALMRHLHPDKMIRGVFITLAPEPDVRQRCAELGIELAR